jgi:hypothetical protein
MYTNAGLNDNLEWDHGRPSGLQPRKAVACRVAYHAPALQEGSYDSCTEKSQPQNLYAAMFASCASCNAVRAAPQTQHKLVPETAPTV